MKQEKLAYDLMVALMGNEKFIVKRGVLNVRQEDTIKEKYCSFHVWFIKYNSMKYEKLEQTS